MDTTIFEQAARTKLRFAFRGQSTAEDLWDLSMEVLDGIYRRLRAEQKDAETESLMTPNTGDPTLDLKVDIVEHIFLVKKAEKLVKRKKAEKLQRRRRLAEALNRKQEEKLGEMSEEDLLKELSELED